MPEEKIWLEQRLKGYKLGIVSKGEIKVKKAQLQLAGRIVKDDLGTPLLVKGLNMGLERR
ncbi:MAG: hypothetical protein AAFV07_19325 [Bacteroidota bacterium]